MGIINKIRKLFSVHKKDSDNNRGVVLIDLLVSTGMASIVLAGVAVEYANMSKMYYDMTVKDTTISQAQALSQMMAAEIRILGNGVPFEQPNFQIDEASLSDATKADPIDVSVTTASKISFRLNENGDVSVVTTSFDPTLSSTLYVTDVSMFSVGDEFYITNSTISEDDGMWGEITAINTGSKTLTVKNNYVSTPAAIFGVGSLVEKVNVITYDNPALGNSITRNDGNTTLTLAPGSSFSLQFIDINGSTLSLPLTRSVVVNNLRSLRLTINVQSSKRLTTGSFYTATVSHEVGIRNLGLVY